MAKTDYVSLKKLQQIASGTARINGLTPLSRTEITNMYYRKGRIPIPIMKKCDTGIIWIDKHYVAYQIGDGDVHYTYVSKHHIAEELYAYRVARKERNTDVALPSDILRCFRVACQKMRGSGLPYWIDARWTEVVCYEEKNLMTKAKVNISEHLNVV